MALEIATIPVLTGEVAENFEAQANRAYQESVSRKDENSAHRLRYERGVSMVKEILAHSNL